MLKPLHPYQREVFDKLLKEQGLKINNDVQRFISEIEEELGKKPKNLEEMQIQLARL
jgi:hypothetical protein